MARAISKLAPAWWDYTTLDSGILNDAAKLTAKDLEQLSEQLHGFLQNYQAQLPVYERELRRANHDFSTGSFLQSLLR